jgi:predicted nucleic acid-binding protein
VKFLDANIFLRFLVEAKTPQDHPRHEATYRLFQSVEAGEAVATSELIVHEVLFILTSEKHYGFSKAEAVGMLKPLLEFRAVSLPRKRLILEALGLFRDYAFLDFPDTVSIVLSREDGYELTSYDRGLSRVPGVRRVEP